MVENRQLKIPYQTRVSGLNKKIPDYKIGLSPENASGNSPIFDFYNRISFGSAISLQPFSRAFLYHSLARATSLEEK